MMWFLRRALVVWLTLASLCIAGVAVARLDHSPNMLQRLGFGLCDGEECFKGIKIGTKWQAVPGLLPGVVETDSYLEFPANSDNLKRIRISGETPSTSVRNITIDHPDQYPFASLTAGDIVAQYGTPCRVYLSFRTENPFQIVFIYPAAVVSVFFPRGHELTTHYQLMPDSPIGDFMVTKGSYFGGCSDAPSEASGPWQGFISTDMYHLRFLRALDNPQP